MRKICAGILILTMITAVGCSGTNKESQTAEQLATTNINDQADLSEMIMADKKTTHTGGEISTENESEGSSFDVIQEERSDEAAVYRNENSDNVSENGASFQKNEMYIDIPDEEDVISAIPQTTQAENKSTPSKTTTVHPAEPEEVIVTESVIELPFVPVR